MKKNKRIFCLLFMFTILVISCREKFTPRPYGYFRIDLPEPAYHSIDSFPFNFDMSDYACIQIPIDAERGWINIYYPQIKGTVYCSYKQFKAKEFRTISEESHTLAYKHVVRADAISERFFSNEESGVFGILYEMKGYSASPIQFFLTDSLSRSFRGSLYFNALPNPDSIAPVVDFVRNDIVRLMETFEWN